MRRESCRICGYDVFTSGIDGPEGFWHLTCLANAQNRLMCLAKNLELAGALHESYDRGWNACKVIRLPPKELIRDE